LENALDHICTPFRSSVDEKLLLLDLGKATYGIHPKSSVDFDY
jgi:hypothetical protein